MKTKLLLFVVALLMTMHLYADNIKKTYTFEKPQFEKNGQFITLQYKNCQNFGPEGAPAMPYFAAEVLLPPGHEIVNIKVDQVNWYNAYENIIISPAQRQFPLDQDFKSPYVVEADESVYNLKSIYPAKMVNDEITQFLSGHAIGGFTICPVVYHPSESKIELIQSITIIIETAETEKSTQSIRNLKQNRSVINRVKNAVDNPEDLTKYSYLESAKVENEVDLLIVTSEDLMPGFQDFVDYKTSVGFIVELKDVNDIYSEYEGQDKPEKIRNCIIDYYQNKNLNYVILGGDADGNVGGDNIVPVRGFFGSPFGLDELNIPADMYYSCLDGDWDNDGDNIFGEEGEEDLFAEVFVGRLSVDNIEQIENFTNKIIKYQEEPVVEDIEKALMMGESLWPQTYGADYKDEVADGSDENGYITVGIPQNYTITRLYERDEEWEKQDVFDQFNTQGVHFANFMGGSNEFIKNKVTVRDITTANFQNNGVDRGFVIDYSQGSYCGAFDNRNPDYYGDEDCFAEQFTNFKNGAVACIYNTRSGWGQFNGTDGGSQYYDRQFFDAIFGENITVIGEANADSKSDNFAFFDYMQGAIRYCAYEVTLFGDPSMDIWTANPTSFSAIYNDAITVGSEQFEVNTGLEGARVALLQNNQLIGRAIANESGSAVVETFEPITSQNPIKIIITGHNKNKYEGTIVVLDDAPYVGLKDFAIVGSPDYGASVTMDVKFKNFAEIGSGFDAQGVTAKLRTADTYVVINDSVADLGNIVAGDSVNLSDAFSFTVKDSVPDQHEVNFEVIVTGSNNESFTWISNANVLLNAPVLLFGDLVIVDTTFGNGNGIADTGEIVEVKVMLENMGHASVSNVTASMEILNDEGYLTLLNTDFSIGELNVDEAKEASFEVTLSESFLNGTLVDVLFTANGATDAQYQALAENRVTLGYVPEYCESEALLFVHSDLVGFKFGPLENNTEGDCGTYDDFTQNEDLLFEFVSGATYDISVSLGTCGANFEKGAKVFVDWNYDGDFLDEGENIFTVNPQNGNFTETGSVTIPSDVVTGPKILRVIGMNAESAYDITPCAIYYNGGTEDYKIIVVEPEVPMADFELNPTETTVGDVVELVDLSLNMPTEWEWFITPGTEGTDFVFVNETSANSQNPQVKFQTIGQYSVELLATNGEGSDTLSLNNCITINEVTAVPAVDFVVDDTLINPGDIVHFTDLSTNTPNQWEWTITPGTIDDDFSFIEGTDQYSQNPIIRFDEPGFYTIQLIASNFIGASEPLIMEDRIEVLANFFMGGGKVRTCEGMFYDEGGPDGFYFDNTNYEITFFPGEQGKMLNFEFTEFYIEATQEGYCFDELSVYNGSNSSADLINVYCGLNTLTSVTALNPEGALTFVFESDWYGNLTGWVASISCVDSYDVTFVVEANGNPVPEALVRCNGISKLTDENGEAVINLLAGEYDYLVISSEYGNINNSFELVDQDTTINVSMVGMNSIIEAGLKIYPNPSKGSVNIELDKEIGEYKIQIIDMQGREVISQYSSQQKNVIDIHSLSDGIYQIIIQNDKYHHVQKFIKL